MVKVKTQIEKLSLTNDWTLSVYMNKNMNIPLNTNHDSISLLFFFWHFLYKTMKILIPLNMKMKSSVLFLDLISISHNYIRAYECYISHLLVYVEQSSRETV